MSPRSMVVFALLFVAALASWYVARFNGIADDVQTGVDPVHRGFYLYEIRAEHAEEQLDGRIVFTDVRFDYSPESDVPWTVDADSATILPSEPRVKLRGHIRAISAQGFSASDTEIRTQYLELDPERYLAETDERVQIRIGARSLTATGMLASLDDNRLELKSNVSGKFVP